MSGTYTGPLPEKAGIPAEEVIVRSVRAHNDGDVIIMDRVRYIAAGDPHNVNRVIEVRDSHSERARFRAGDQLVVSTEFLTLGESGPRAEVPNWPGHDYVEFLIGVHRVTSAEPVNRMVAADGAER